MTEDYTTFLEQCEELYESVNFIMPRSGAVSYTHLTLPTKA